MVASDAADSEAIPLLSNAERRHDLTAAAPSRRSLLAVVVSVLFLDSVLLSAVVPVLPAYLSGQGTPEWKIAVLFGSKALVQLLVNPFVAPVVNRSGARVVMLCGTVIMTASSAGFAVSSTYGQLLAARAIQGIGSACSGCAGFALAAQLFPEDALRGPAMAMATAGVGLGVVAGPPFGGAVYSSLGKEWPFYVLAIAGSLCLVVQLVLPGSPPRKWLIETTRQRHRTLVYDSVNFNAEVATDTVANDRAESIVSLLKDQDIRRLAVTFAISNSIIAAVEPTLPLWWISKFDTSARTIGLIFLSASLSYTLGSAIVGAFGLKIGRSMAVIGCLGLTAIGVVVIVWPGTRTSPLESIPGLLLLGGGIGGCEAAINPLLASIVEARHPNSEGSAYALMDMCFALGFAIGPFLSAVFLAGDAANLYLYSSAAILCVIASFLVSSVATPKSVRNEPPIAPITSVGGDEWDTSTHFGTHGIQFCTTCGMRQTSNFCTVCGRSM